MIERLEGWTDLGQGISITPPGCTVEVDDDAWPFVLTAVITFAGDGPRVDDLHIQRRPEAPPLRTDDLRVIALIDLGRQAIRLPDVAAALAYPEDVADAVRADPRSLKGEMRLKRLAYIHRRAMLFNDNVVQAIMQELQVSQSTAVRLIALARADGLLDPPDGLDQQAG